MSSHRPTEFRHMVILQIRTHEKNGKTTHFSYKIRTERSSPFARTIRFKSEPLRQDPSEHFKDFFEKIEEAKYSNEDMSRTLDEFGYELTERLFPEPLERFLWQLRNRENILQIQSDEGWIPWEMLKIRHPATATDDQSEAGVYLCEAFNLTRWRLDLNESYLHLPLQCIAAAGEVSTNAHHGERRGEHLIHAPAGLGDADFLKCMEGTKRTVQIVTGKTLIENMASGRFDGWHLNGHGEARGLDPNSWPLRFHDGTEISPKNLSDGRMRKIGQRHPLVFLNACQTGRSAPALTGIGGWADNFLKLESGAFIGTFWSTTDEAASYFVTEFYSLFFQRIPIGEAVRQARLATRNSFRDDLTWLAYVVFAHPLAKCDYPPPSSSRNRKAIIILVAVSILVTFASLWICRQTQPLLAFHSSIPTDVKPHEPDLPPDDQDNSPEDSQDDNGSQTGDNGANIKTCEIHVTSTEGIVEGARISTKKRGKQQEDYKGATGSDGIKKIQCRVDDIIVVESMDYRTKEVTIDEKEFNQTKSSEEVGISITLEKEKEP